MTAATVRGWPGKNLAAIKATARRALATRTKAMPGGNGFAGARSVTLVCLVSAPEGIEHVQAEHPDVRIVTAAVDRGLDERGYIVPGLGDAGDRLYGTR